MAEIKTIAVLGAGTMGHGIAQVAAQAGYQAFLYDVSRDLAEKGVRKISENLKRGVDKGKVSPEERDAALARITPVDDLEAVSRCDLLIEAIPEDLSLKRGLFKQLSEICASTTILASNTSSLSLTDIAAAARGPERVVGMHFFNPVHLMKLLEIVRAYQTSDATVQAVRGVGTRMGKQMIEVKDRPGDGAGLRPSDGSAQARRSGWTGCQTGDCRVPLQRAGQRCLSPSAAPQTDGQGRQAGPKNRRGILQIPPFRGVTLPGTTVFAKSAWTPTS